VYTCGDRAMEHAFLSEQSTVELPTDPFRAGSREFELGQGSRRFVPGRIASSPRMDGCWRRTRLAEALTRPPIH
jgi:hypothetical protein